MMRFILGLALVLALTGCAGGIASFLAADGGGTDAGRTAASGGIPTAGARPGVGVVAPPAAQPGGAPASPAPVPGSSAMPAGTVARRESTLPPARVPAPPAPIATAPAPGPAATAPQARLALYVSPAPQSAGAPVMLRAGEGATFRLAVQSNAPVRYTFTSGQRYDLRIERQGRVVWRWSAGRMFTQAVSELTLAPESPWEFRERWNGFDLNGKPLAPGRYRIVAMLVGQSEDGAAPAPAVQELEVR